MPAEPTTLNSLDPVPNFRFGISVEGSPDLIGIFTECILPSIEWDVVTVKEGGRNKAPHRLLGQRKPGNVTLRQGLTKQFVLIDWYAAMMNEDFSSYKKTVTITLLDGQGKALMRWNLHDAFPINVKFPELKAGDNAIAIQSLELACDLIRFEKESST